MRKIADGVWQLSGFPHNYFNIYLADDVLVDAGTRWARRRVLHQLRDRPPRLVALTHCHPDHQGAADAACTTWKIPLACHEADVPAMEGKTAMLPDNRILRLGARLWAGPSRPVERVLHDGDTLGAFRVVHAPGHTPGHIILFRDSDRLAIAGDVLANIHFVTGRPGLREPPHFFSHDWRQNRQSIRKLADLRPALVCFGHGPPLAKLERLEAFVARLG